MSRGAVLRADDGRLRRRPLIDRLLDRLPIGDADECWEWPGGRSSGYGMIGTGGTESHNVYVHRLSYEHFVGPIPDGLTIDHLCRNRACANPAHLEPVTLTTNLLRGNGPAGINSRKTTCAHGHPFTVRNTYIYANGKRRCRECARLYQLKLRRQRRAS